MQTYVEFRLSFIVLVIAHERGQSNYSKMQMENSKILNCHMKKTRETKTKKKKKKKKRKKRILVRGLESSK